MKASLPFLATEKTNHTIFLDCHQTSIKLRFRLSCKLGDGEHRRCLLGAQMLSSRQKQQSSSWAIIAKRRQTSESAASENSHTGENSFVL